MRKIPELGVAVAVIGVTSVAAAVVVVVVVAADEM